MNVSQLNGIAASNGAVLDFWLLIKVDITDKPEDGYTMPTPERRIACWTAWLFETMPISAQAPHWIAALCIPVAAKELAAASSTALAAA